MNRIFIFLIVQLFFLYSCTNSQKTEQPNVLILVADDLGYSDLHCFGGNAHSPNLDRLAENGIRLTHFYAPAPNCSPSRTGLLTGRFPSRVGMYNYRAPNQVMHLPASEITIAEKLKEIGYQTAHFGKWHLSCLPQDSLLNQAQPIEQGFDYSFGTENNAIPSHLNPTNFVRNGKLLGETSGFSCQILANEVNSWFEKIYQKNKPFFLYVAFHEVHTKIASPENLIQNYPGLEQKEAEYLANIENMDNAAGKILEELKNRGLLENTFVLFASDNGPYKKGSAGNLRGLKGEVYEGGIRVPGIIQWPGKINAGQVNATPAGLIDVFPTLATICDFELPEDRKIDGTTILPLFENIALNRKTPLTWFFYRAYPEISMRVNDYVLIGNALDSIARTHPISSNDMNFIKFIQLKEFELYNIIQDPAQEKNLIHSSPVIASEMKSKMIQLLEEIKNEGPNWKGLPNSDSLPSRFKQNYIRK